MFPLAFRDIPVLSLTCVCLLLSDRAPCVYLCSFLDNSAVGVTLSLLSEHLIEIWLAVSTARKLSAVSLNKVCKTLA